MHVPNSSKGSYRLLSNPIFPGNELFQAQKYATIGLLSRCSSVVEQLFCKQQVAGSIPLTGSIFLRLNQADFGKSHRSIIEKCPPNAPNFQPPINLRRKKAPVMSRGLCYLIDMKKSARSPSYPRALIEVGTSETGGDRVL